MGLIRRLSIHQRLLLAASLVLTAFFGFTGLALDSAFRSSAEEALESKLYSSVYALLAAAEEDGEGRLKMPAVLTDPRFNRPGSGLYALVIGSEVDYRWRSGSAVGQGLSFPPGVTAGDSKLEQRERPNGDSVMRLSFGVVWEDFEGRELSYTLVVVEDLGPLNNQVSIFRNRLLFWLGGAALLLLLVQGLVLRWGLSPLRDVAEAVTDIESGAAQQLQGEYPRELTPLTSNINSLIHHASARQQRYRDSLGDLAHSLKTPLAILQGLADRDDPIGETDQQLLNEQVARMNQIVGHQLQRAAASGQTSLSSLLPVKPVVTRIADSLSKVYAEKKIAWQFDLSDDIRFQGDEADLMEMLGNLMENACKYGAARISVSGMMDDALILKVEDDGPGISDNQAADVLQRGHRADQQAPGQGIGLAVVADIVRAYKGNLSIGRSTGLGGAEMMLSLPCE
jgi:two-component system sensor histidine kinase PhoQ